MTSKRNSRAFVDESVHTSEDSSSRSGASSLCSRRNSRSSTREEFLQAALEAEEGMRASNGGSTNRENKDTLPKVSETEGNDNSSQSFLIPRESDSLSPDFARQDATMVEENDFPSAPLNGRPSNFGVVIPGLYRSSYPKASDYPYLQSLQLKTMVTLVKKDGMDEELSAFVSQNGINQLIFNMKGTKKEAISPSTMSAILEVMLDRRNYPLMLHCNHGKHRTGCVIAAVRKIAGWDMRQVLDEYRTYAGPKVRDCDVDYITSFQAPSHLAPVVGITTTEAHHYSTQFTPVQLRAFLRALLVSGLLMFVWLLSGRQMMSTRDIEFSLSN
jgi:tyrosine-protein phosphatase SIW14